MIEVQRQQEKHLSSFALSLLDFSVYVNKDPLKSLIIFLKMNAGNEKVEPKTDLLLGMNYSNQCILKNDSGVGAGANAASILDMNLVATGPLSELVWSPDKGLSLKCADSSFAHEKTSLFWDAALSNFVLAMPQSGIGVTSTTDKPADDVFAKPIAAVCIKSNIPGTDNTTTKHLTSDSGVKLESKQYKERDTGKDKIVAFPGSHTEGSNGNMEEMSNAERNICNQANSITAHMSRAKEIFTISGQVEKMQYDAFLPKADEAKPSMEQNALPRDHANGGGDIGVGNQAFETDDVLSSRVHPIIEYKGSGALGTKLTSSSRSPFEKLESTAENDLQTLNCEAAWGSTSKVLVSKYNEIEKKSQDHEIVPQCDTNLPELHAPSNGRIHMFGNNGKEKALSDGNINVKLSLKEEDDSHESVESCNSTQLFPTGRKRLNFQQQLMVRSKRVKKQIQETSVSRSVVKQDCSFMNWISNMMKGFPQSIQEATNCMAYTHAYPDHGHQWPDQKLITFNRNQDPEPKNIGFQSIFQSIYSPSPKQLEEDSKNLDVVNKVHGIDATPLTCYAENDSLNRQILHSDEFEESSLRFEAGSSWQPINLATSHDSSKDKSGEDKNFLNLKLSKEKEGMISNSSSAKQKSSNTENVDSFTHSERKEADNISHRIDTTGSLWITRFFPNTNAPLKISDQLNENGETQVHSTDCSVLPTSHKHIAHSNKCQIAENRGQSADEVRKLQNCSLNEEASNGTMNDKAVNDHPMHKFNHVWPSPRFRTTEPMASMLARRPDAVKHIIPSDRKDSSSKKHMTCLFCGTGGHQLCDCSEIAGNELHGLIKKANSHVGLEELPCVCIKCFQSNHWAISCPASISRGKHELEVNALIKDYSLSRIQFDAVNRECPKLATSQGDQLISGCAVNIGTDRQAKKNLELKQKSNEIITFGKITSNASTKKQSGSKSEENNLKDNPMRPPSCFVERKISDVPEQIFNAVKKLRLSRNDILKWINSAMSISHLNGFYLRLRLGKWEEELGGTGYYVAFINEAHRQSSEQNTGKSLSVNIGGIKCTVESRFISNHDFLEDEIMAWWDATSKCSGDMPSEEDLIEKIKKKRMLGF